MPDRFYPIFKKNCADLGLESRHRILVAISGGVDSVVLARLLHRAGYRIVLAHANFGLRGADSVADAVSVAELADELKVTLHLRRFSTKEFAADRGLSIQMAARQLRYDWFNELCDEENYDFIATAHHRDDAAETILMNLVKGSVLDGLCGIRPRLGRLLRPLLWAEKEEIRQYALERNWAWREDVSNAEDKYARNLIRNQVMPLLRKLNPELSQTMTRAAGERSLIRDAWHEQRESIWEQSAVPIEVTGWQVPLSALQEDASLRAALGWQLRKAGAGAEVIREVIQSLAKSETLHWPISDSNELVMDKYALYLLPQRLNEAPFPVNISAGMESVDFEGVTYSLKQNAGLPFPQDLRNPGCLYLPADTIRWPLTLRRWQLGDRMQPFGMKGSKKISDIITDLKLSYPEKLRQAVLTDADGRILWLVGRRASELTRMDGDSEVVRICREG